jgi:hypothetical protein
MMSAVVMAVMGVLLSESVTATGDGRVLRVDCGNQAPEREGGSESQERAHHSPPS